jgi:hypothetical protein
MKAWTVASYEVRSIILPTQKKTVRAPREGHSFVLHPGRCFHPRRASVPCRTPVTAAVSM